MIFKKGLVTCRAEKNRKFTNALQTVVPYSVTYFLNFQIFKPGGIMPWAPRNDVVLARSGKGSG